MPKCSRKKHKEEERKKKKRRRMVVEGGSGRGEVVEVRSSEVAATGDHQMRLRNQGSDEAIC